MKKNFVYVSVLCFSLSTLAFANEFHCAGSGFNGNKIETTLAGTIVADDQIEDVVFSINGLVGFEAKKLVGNPKYRPTSEEFKNYQHLMPLTPEDMIKGEGLKNYYNIKLLMPKNLTLQNRFKAYVREQGSDGGSSNPLDCFIEN